MFRTLALSAVAVAALGCQSESERPTAKPSDGQAAKPQQAESAAREPDPFCRTYRIFVNGAQRGYLLRYEEMPGHMTTERKFATGTAFIQNMDFEELGFITPNGSVYRVGSGATPGTAHSEKVTQGELLKSLALFYDPEGAVKVTLEPITGTAAPAPVAKPAAPADKQAPKANGEKADAKDKTTPEEPPANDKADGDQKDGG